MLTPNTLGNSNLKPERVEGLELGFETGMFSDRFGIDFTYFRDVSKDAILSRGVAPSSGFGLNSTTERNTQFFNAGQITKQGVELGAQGPDHQRARLRLGRELHVRHALVEDRPAERQRHDDRPRELLPPRRVRAVRLVLVQGAER